MSFNAVGVQCFSRVSQECDDADAAVLLRRTCGIGVFSMNSTIYACLNVAGIDSATQRLDWQLRQSRFISPKETP